MTSEDHICEDTAFVSRQALQRMMENILSCCGKCTEKEAGNFRIPLFNVVSIEYFTCVTQHPAWRRNVAQLWIRKPPCSRTTLTRDTQDLAADTYIISLEERHITVLN